MVRAQLALLRQVAPHVSRVGLFFNPSVVNAEVQNEEAGATFLPVREEADQLSAFNRVFSTVRKVGLHGLIVFSDPMMRDYRRTIVGLVRGCRLPAIFDAEEFVAAGGLMSFGAPAPCLRDIDSVIAYVDTQGTPAASGTSELVVNGKAASELGLVVPPALARARRVA
jgi:putative ABC transport system substrate-binding protein